MKIDLSDLRKRAAFVLDLSRNKPDMPVERQVEILSVQGKPPSALEVALIADAAGVDVWWIINGERAPEVIDQTPVDIHAFRPEPMDRERALEWVIENKDSSLSRIWALVVAPLYDRLAYEANYQNGYCRKCQVRHPTVWREKNPDKPWPGHTMSCPIYTGPVEHRRTRFEDAGGIFKFRCTCGTKWSAPQVTDETKKCPSEESWRGPEREEEVRGE